MAGPKPVPLDRPSLSRVTHYLQDNDRIGTLRLHYKKQRYAKLYLQGLFNSLVSLYTPLFQTQWPHFSRFMDQFTPPAGVLSWTFATRNYISAWIHDLYVSNRAAARKLSPLAFSQHYQHEEIFYYSFEYDEFLVRLNASIRPTRISGSGTMEEETLFFPILDDDPAWNTDNPLHINGFHLDYDLVCNSAVPQSPNLPICSEAVHHMVMGIIGIMKDYKAKINMSTLVTDDSLGRPSWLFDWHTDNRCCAWFPMEGNYNLDDVSIAYIVGVACTPNLGHCDVDDWQEFPNGTAPGYINVASYDRMIDRRFFGSYEVRTIEQRQQAQLTPAVSTQQVGAPKKDRGKGDTSKPGASESTEIVQLTDWFQIIDWTYYHLVVLAMDPHTRFHALRMIVQG